MPTPARSPPPTARNAVQTPAQILVPTGACMFHRNPTRADPRITASEIRLNLVRRPPMGKHRHEHFRKALAPATRFAQPTQGPRATPNSQAARSHPQPARKTGARQTPRPMCLPCTRWRRVLSLRARGRGRHLPPLSGAASSAVPRIRAGEGLRCSHAYGSLKCERSPQRSGSGCSRISSIRSRNR